MRHWGGIFKEYRGAMELPEQIFEDTKLRSK